MDKQAIAEWLKEYVADDEAQHSSTAALASVDPNITEILAGIRFLLDCFNGRNRCKLPPGNGDRWLEKRLLGVWLQKPNRLGVREHLLAQDWKDALAFAGIDPEEIQLTDKAKLLTAIQSINERAEQQKRDRARRAAQRQKDAPSAGIHLTETEFDALAYPQKNAGWMAS